MRDADRAGSRSDALRVVALCCLVAVDFHITFSDKFGVCVW